MNTVGRMLESGPVTADASTARSPIPALIGSLAARGVRYCHWKSNVRLAESLAGDGDLDILVRRSDAQPFFAALADAGFKLAEAATGTGHAGVLHAFALDPERLRLAHVHAYFQVVTGDSIVKSYRLPFEGLLLEGDRRDCGVPLPPAEAELMVFLLRVALKHTGPAETLLLNLHYAPVPDELAWLRANADEAVARALWNSSIPGADDDEFDRLLAAVAAPSALVRRVDFGLRLGWRLRGWRRLGYLAAFVSRLRRLARLIWCRVLHRRPRHLAAGGAIIALVGPKASGKSTMGAALDDCLGKQFDLRRIHGGKPPATLLSTPSRLLLPLLRRLMPGERSGEYQRPERQIEMRYSYAYLLRMVLLAYDRRALLLGSRRAATGGTIVVADRYPSTDIGAIDSSQFSDAAVAACGSWARRVLMRLERRCYRNLPKPDLVIRLSAPIETTLLRDASRNKPEGPVPESLRRRRDSETAAEFPNVPVLEVSTDRPLEPTVADIVRGAWLHL